MVSAREMAGTIGGGALEFDAIAHARRFFEKDEVQIWLRDVKDYPLGPQLGQCCGGHVRLLFERFGAEEITHIATMIDHARYVARPITSGTALNGITGSEGAKAAPDIVHMQFQRFEKENGAGAKCALLGSAEGEWLLESVSEKPIVIYLYGAGHVGREVVRVFEGLSEITWIDTDEDRFPDPLPGHVQRLIVAAPHEAVAYAPDNAFHIVMSYSHPLDLEICHAVLKRERFRYLGLIGSMTKRGRFLKRLKKLGIKDADLSRLTCPIGADGPKSKEPAVIAISLAVEILRLAETPQNYQETD